MTTAVCSERWSPGLCVRVLSNLVADKFVEFLTGSAGNPSSSPLPNIGAGLPLVLVRPRKRRLDSSRVVRLSFDCAFEPGRESCMGMSHGSDGAPRSWKPGRILYEWPAAIAKSPRALQGVSFGVSCTA